LQDPSALADEPRGLARLAAAWRDASRRRKLTSLGIALAIEALILLLLLTLGAQMAGREDAKPAVPRFTAIELAAPPKAEPPPPTDAADAAEAPVTPTAPEPMPRPPFAWKPQSEAPSAPPAPPEPPKPTPTPTPQTPARPKSTIGAKVDPSRSYGPVDSGNPRMAGDSERVGSMPNGEPLYAARWYREPSDSELAGYLSTAKPPGYALIACKVVEGYYVENCQLLGESPQGAMIGRAVMAAAWQFRVRPARLGGRDQFGTWVRIRIDYTVDKRSR
jgi:protein TonB